MGDASDMPRDIKTWDAHAMIVEATAVLRAVPTDAVRAVGPFVFLDHLGPAVARTETLPAHPHAGIEVITHLPSGANETRDSMGHRGVAPAGGAQWMRAGRGILHSETVLAEGDPVIHGPQISARLPAFLLHLRLPPGRAARIALPDPDHEYGVYSIEAPGTLRLDGHVMLTRGGMGRLDGVPF